MRRACFFLPVQSLFASFSLVHCRTRLRRRSIPSFASWRRGACYLPSISAPGAFRGIRLDITDSRARFTRISRVRFGDMLVSKARIEGVRGTLMPCVYRRPRTPSTFCCDLAHPVARFASLQVERGADHGRDQPTASYGADGGTGQRRVLRRSGSQGPSGGARQGGGNRSARGNHGRRVRDPDV